MSTTIPSSLYLVPLAGPSISPLHLECPQAGQPLTVGRHDQCELKLPASASSISRFHARFRYDEPSVQWRVSDLDSSWGTWLNGVKLPPRTEMPLAENDLLRLEPWTFSVQRTLEQEGVESTDDTGQTNIRTIGKVGAPPQRMREDVLAVLLSAAGAIQQAPTELILAEQLVDAAIRGTNLPNAAMIRSHDGGKRIEVIAARTPRGKGADGFAFSRSVLNAAAGGQVVEMSRDGINDSDQSVSIIQLKIAMAICVPLMLGDAPAAYLYLDARSGTAESKTQVNGQFVAGFCAALGTLAGLALANLKRLDIERRQASIEHDLNAAAAAQKWVFPPRKQSIANFTITGESRPGRYVGGDFFDVIDLGDGRVAVALGDVSGKGVDASVLMTATQGFLHATLRHDGDPAIAAKAVNQFVMPRRPTSRFVTLWVGVLDPKAGTVSYVDAGHGYAVLQHADQTTAELNDGDGPPIGILDNYPYQSKVEKLPPHGRIIVVSDGIVEQPAIAPAADGSIDSFNLAGVIAALAAGQPNDEIGTVFEHLIAHAGTTQLADDATGVCIRW